MDFARGRLASCRREVTGEPLNVASTTDGQPIRAGRPAAEDVSGSVQMTMRELKTINAALHFYSHHTPYKDRADAMRDLARRLDHTRKRYMKKARR